MSESILVPIDMADQETGLKIIKEGVAQAQLRGASLTVMSVVPDIMAGLDYRYAIRGEMHGSEKYDLREIVKEALGRLNEIVEEHTPDGMEVETIVRHGSAYEQILNVAKEIGATGIILGAHRASLADYLIGTTTARVVRHAECSVQVVR